MGLLYDLKQKEYDDGEREFIEQSKPYIEFLDLLQSISDFTKDTPHTVAKFLYEDKEIFTLTSYDLEFEPQENTGYYEYDEKLDDYTKIIVSYSEWFFRTFLDFDNIKEFQDVLDLFGYCFFKKTDILTLDCLKKIGFVDISLLEEIDEIERLTRENIEQKKIIEKLSNALSLKTNATETTTLQNQLDQAQAYIAELEQQLAKKNSTPAIREPFHTNTALTALFDVMNTYWKNPEQPPKQEFIKQWIVEKYPSIDPSKALWIDKIIRHQDRK